LKEELIRIWQLKMVLVTPPALSTVGITGNKLHGSLKLLDLRPGVHILLQKAVILNTCHILGKVLAEQLI
jgi:hypothetical protein